MFLKSANFSHEEEKINRAMGVDDQLLILCRERILFCHFASAIQSLELFGDRDLAPKELTTLTGNLQRCLNMITNQAEYEITLLHFMSYHRIAQEAVAYWNYENDPKNSAEDKLKLQLVKMLKKLKETKETDENDDNDENDINHDISNLDTLIQRIEYVKKANYNFPKYLDLVGIKPFKDVDNILKDIFSADL